MTLAVAAAIALIWANVEGGRAYRATWNRVAPWSSLVGVHLTLRDSVNQGLLFVFFALVGLEIRREFTAGELRTLRRAAVPILAALAGMAVPALIYTAAVAGGSGAKGWGIPMATDIGFALGALALIGTTSGRARVFLMTLAVADDIASIMVLVAFYGHHTRLSWLLPAVGALVTLGAVWARSLPGWWIRAVLAAFAWWALLRAGVDAAVVGAALGVFGPGRRATKGTARIATVRRWVVRLEPAVNGVVLPLFALANIGTTFGLSLWHDAAAMRVLAAVTLARLLGKPIGITAGTVLARRIVGVDDPRISPRELVGVATLGSIGFTVPLLIIAQALPAGNLTDAAILGLLISSVVGAGGGWVVLRLLRPRH